MNVELAYLAQNAVVEVSARLMQMHLLQMEILVKNNFQKVIVGFPQVQELKTRLVSLSFARGKLLFEHKLVHVGLLSLYHMGGQSNDSRISIYLQNLGFWNLPQNGLQILAY